MACNVSYNVQLYNSLMIKPQPYYNLNIRYLRLDYIKSYYII
jgi:hypothetical protein